MIVEFTFLRFVFVEHLHNVSLLGYFSSFCLYQSFINSSCWNKECHWILSSLNNGVVIWLSLFNWLICELHYTGFPNVEISLFSLEFYFSIFQCLSFLIQKEMVVFYPTVFSWILKWKFNYSAFSNPKAISVTEKNVFVLFLS